MKRAVQIFGIIITQCLVATVVYGYLYRPYARSGFAGADLALAATFLIPAALSVLGMRSALASVKTALGRTILIIAIEVTAFFVSISCAFTNFGT